MIESHGGIDEMKMEGARLHRLFEAYRQDADRALQTKLLGGVPEQASPGHLLKLARTDPTVSSVLNYWRNGTMPLENMLILCVDALVGQKNELMKRAQTAMEAADSMGRTAFDALLREEQREKADAPTIMPRNG